jgi:hypothetical protein
MKTTRNVVPALLALVVLVAAGLVAYSVMSRGGVGQQGTQAQQREQGQGAELVDTGTNAGLSNAELVSVAITNMMALKSYHMEFTGPAQRLPTIPAAVIADVQMPNEGEGEDDRSGGRVWSAPGRYRFISGAYMAEGYQVPAEEMELLWASDDQLYFTTDGGKVWQGLEGRPGGFAAIGAIGTFALSWWYYLGPPVELDFSDGSPRLEKVDGTLTRHVTADLTDLENQGFAPYIAGETPNQVELWVSTGATPLVHKVVAKGIPSLLSTPEPQVTAETGMQGVVESELYTLTWTWSRFNEDFGKIEPPPTTTVKEP